MEKSGHGCNGIYRSLWLPISVPKCPNHCVVAHLFRNHSSFNDKRALIDAHTDKTLNFSQFKSIIAEFAHGLLQLGVKKKDIVLIFVPNMIQFPICFFGILAIGVVTTTVNSACTTAKLSKQMKDSTSTAMITIKDLLNKVKDFDVPVFLI